MEMQGVDNLMDSSGPFHLNLWHGEHWPSSSAFEGPIAEGGNEVQIDGSTISGGVQPTAYLANAEINGGMLTAGPGVFVMNVDVWGAELRLPIVGGRVVATVDVDNSSLEGGGIALEDGALGGAVLLSDLYAGINQVAASCECLGLTGDFLEIDAEGITATCNTSDVGTCATADENGAEICAQLVDNCSVLERFHILADIDVDLDETNDALSAGATFSAVGATIVGVRQPTTDL